MSYADSVAAAKAAAEDDSDSDSTDSSVAGDEVDVVFRKAIAKGDMEQVLHALELQPNIGTADDSGRTIIHIAAMSKHMTVELMSTLLTLCSFAVTIPDASQSLPIHLACSVPQPLPVLKLIIAEAENNGVGCCSWPDGQGRYPLHLALAAGASPDTIRMLLELNSDAVNAPTDDGTNALQCALKGKASPDIVSLLFALSVDPTMAVMAENGEGLRAVHIAVMCDADMGTISQLMDLDLSAASERLGSDASGKTLLHLAAQAGARVEVLERILTANPAAAGMKDDSDDCLPLHLYIASKKATAEGVRMLLMLNPSSAQAQSKRGGGTPLSVALRHNASAEVLGLLVEASPEVLSQVDDEGLNIVTRSVLSGCITAEAVRMLLKVLPAAAMTPNEKGLYLLHHACNNNETASETLQAVVEAYPQAAFEKDHKQRLPLHIAVYRPLNANCLQVLLLANPEAVKAPHPERHCLPLVDLLARRPSSEAVLAVLNAWPTAAQTKTPDGDYPLHLLAYNGCKRAAMVAMIAAFPEAVSAVSPVDGMVPLRRFLEGIISRSTGLDPDSELVASLTVLLEAYPDACKPAAPTAAGAAAAAPPPPPSSSKVAQRSILHSLAVLVAHKLPLSFVETVLKIDSSSLNTQDGGKATPLHTLLRSSTVPLEAIKLFGTPEACMMRDDHDNLPLHWCIERNHGAKVMREVLELCPTAAKEPRTKSDGRRQFPLHQAMGNGAGVDVLRLLASYGPDVLDKPAPNGARLAHLAVDYVTRVSAIKTVEEVMAFALEVDPAGACAHDNSGTLAITIAATHMKSYPHAVALISPLLQTPGVLAATLQDGGRPMMVLLQAGCKEAVQKVIDKDVTAFTASLDPRRVLQRRQTVSSLIAKAPHVAAAAASAAAARTGEAPDPAAAAAPRHGTAAAAAAVAANSALTYATRHVSWYPIMASNSQLEIQELAMAILARCPSMAHVRALAQLRDPHGRATLDTAPLQLRMALLKRLYLFEKYEVQSGMAGHESATCIVRFATDRKVEPPLLVALKFMRNREHFEKEARSRSDFNLSGDYVVDVIETYDGDEDPRVESEGPLHGFPPAYKYCCVLPAAQRTLHDIIAHEHVASKDWSQIKAIGRALGESLGHLHEQGLVHCDIKPLNVVRLGGTFRLIDLDACSPLGQPAGSKFSSGFVPPELIHVTTAPDAGSSGKPALHAIIKSPEGATLPMPLDAESPVAAAGAAGAAVGGSTTTAPPLLAGGAAAMAAAGLPSGSPHHGTVGLRRVSSVDRQPGAPGEGYAPVPATPAMDMWALGVVMYALTANRPLFLMDHDGNVDPATLVQIHQWDPEFKHRKLEQIPDVMARNLVAQLLSVDPDHRPTVSRYLAHPFLSGRSFTRLPGDEPHFDVFLSYRVASDLKHVEALYDVLCARGLRVWWDKKCLPDGKDWEEAFVEGLVDSRCAACIMSPAGLTNFNTLKAESACDNVLLEHRLALELEAMGMLSAVLPVLFSEAADGVFPGSFFPSIASLPQASVDTVEAKVEHHLERLCLGSPLSAGMTVQQAMSKMMKHQAFCLDRGKPTPVPKAIEALASRLEAMMNRRDGLELSRATSSGMTDRSPALSMRDRSVSNFLSPSPFKAEIDDEEVAKAATHAMGLHETLAAAPVERATMLRRLLSQIHGPDRLLELATWLQEAAAAADLGADGDESAAGAAAGHHLFRPESRFSLGTPPPKASTSAAAGRPSVATPPIPPLLASAPAAASADAAVEAIGLATAKLTVA